MGAHMQVNSDGHPAMQASIRDPAARPPKSRRSGNALDAIDASGVSIAAQSKDCCASAESSTCHSPRKLSTTERSNGTAIKQPNLAFVSSCGKGSVNLKRKRLIQYHRHAAADEDILPRRCSCCKDGHCKSTRHRCGCGSDEEFNCIHETAGKVSEANLELYRMNGIDVVCCMCGDAGIAELLFLCSNCSHRHQHIYCSRSYPNMNNETSICNWCLHEEKFTRPSVLTKANNHGCGISRAVGASASPTGASPDIVVRDGGTGSLMHLKTRNDGEAAGPLPTGHSKAFEYLLLVATKSLCQVDRLIIGTSCDIKPENLATGSTDLNRGSGDRDSDIAKVCETPFPNLLNSRSQRGQSRSGPVSTNPHDSKSRIISAGTHRNMSINDQVKVSISHKNINVGEMIGGSISNSHRSNKDIDALLKCRKKGLQLSPSKPIYRRYKLLADVVC